MASGVIGVHTATVTTNVEVVSKRDSVIVTIPPPFMVALVALVAPRWYEPATHTNVQ